MDEFKEEIEKDKPYILLIKHKSYSDDWNIAKQFDTFDEAFAAREYKICDQILIVKRVRFETKEIKE